MTTVAFLEAPFSRTSCRGQEIVFTDTQPPYLGVQRKDLK